MDGRRSFLARLFTMIGLAIVGASTPKRLLAAFTDSAKDGKDQSNVIKNIPGWTREEGVPRYPFRKLSAVEFFGEKYSDVLTPRAKRFSYEDLVALSGWMKKSKGLTQKEDHVWHLADTNLKDVSGADIASVYKALELKTGLDASSVNNVSLTLVF